jgi:hypothetical protein
MRSFKLSDEYNAVCEWKKTRSAFKHVVTLLKNGVSVYETKICYVNRTWESYEYQSVLQHAIGSYFKGDEKAKYLEVVKDGAF